jgi:hypothetical protein
VNFCRQLSGIAKSIARLRLRLVQVEKKYPREV